MGEANAANAAMSPLAGLVERLERLREDRRQIEADLSEVYGEAKAAGFEVKALKALLARRAQDTRAAGELDSLVDLYAASLAGR
ncbi:MAG TPA: GapR family DNA-binding domain-containing protein [Caulobacteraceae bacterium]|nr:GapR family DNA-binding domain-containing protein [Caulobacteraceae bacterium]